MTVADVIAAARQYTQITNSSWFTPADELRSVNRAYRDIYEKILDSNDEYFIKEVLVPASFLTPVTGVRNTYEYTLPVDLHRLRSMRAIIATGEHQLARIDVNGLQQIEGYRYFQDKLRLVFTNNYNTFRIEYYPSPVEFTATTETIEYPPQLEPLIIAYRIAIDIANAQGGDPAKHKEEYVSLWNRFSHAAERRDDQQYPRISNVYRSTYPGW